MNNASSPHQSAALGYRPWPSEIRRLHQGPSAFGKSNQQPLSATHIFENRGDRGEVNNEGSMVRSHSYCMDGHIEKLKTSFTLLNTNLFRDDSTF